jgi:hypothetical protein
MLDGSGNLSIRLRKGRPVKYLAASIDVHDLCLLHQYLFPVHVASHGPSNALPFTREPAAESTR